jgi:hypothetical protein
VISPEATLPEVLERHPQVRPVLDRYGLHGCGGRLGPPETVRFFARAHGVDEPTLLRELEEAAARVPEAAAPAFRPSRADTIYQPFFKAGIVATLTAGAVWGAWLLLQIGGARSFGAVDLHDVNAHGHAQIFGWVGLFVMGFALQAFPRFRHVSLWRPELGYLAFWTYLGGFLMRVVSEPLHAITPFGVLGPAGAALEVGSIALFCAIVARTWARSAMPRAPHDPYVFASLFWFLVQAVYDAFFLVATTAADSSKALLATVATWQLPLREIQIYGFAGLMILGVSQRYLVNMYGFPGPTARRSRVALWAINAGLVVDVISFVAWRATGAHAWAALFHAGIVAIAAGMGAVGLSFRLHRPCAEGDRGLKFLRAAWLWLGLSLAMVVVAPLYFAARGGFSHAWWGATRHAVTVGFVSLMILGVASKVVPTLKGRDVRALPALWLPFVLVNLGCTMRVVFQALTDFAPWAFAPAGASGLLEVTGIAIWGMSLWRVMDAKDETTPAGPVDRAEPETRVGALLEAHPQLLDLFVARGFEQLRSPVLRRTLARAVTIRQACRLKGVDEEAFLAELNRALPPRAGGAIEDAMPVKEVVRLFPATLPVFAAYGLDACCGGVHPVREAAQHKGLDPERLLAELRAAVAGRRTAAGAGAQPLLRRRRS